MINNKSTALDHWLARPVVLLMQQLDEGIIRVSSNWIVVKWCPFPSVPRTATTVSNGPPTNGQMPPAPPQRNPSTTLSFGRAFAANGGAAQFSTGP